MRPSPMDRNQPKRQDEGQSRPPAPDVEGEGRGERQGTGAAPWLRTARRRSSGQCTWTGACPPPPAWWSASCCTSPSASTTRQPFPPAPPPLLLRLAPAFGRCHVLDGSHPEGSGLLEFPLFSRLLPWTVSERTMVKPARGSWSLCCCGPSAGPSARSSVSS